MKVGLIDCDNKSITPEVFPNLPLMKLSAYHKERGDSVRWYDAFDGYLDKYDLVYESKVFSFSDTFEAPIYADKIIQGGSGFAISLKDGREVYDKSKDTNLPEEIEHIYPDYGLYGIKDKAFGFITRGCPRGCDFCHVAKMQGRKTVKVAELSEFWRGQKEIVLLDPNLTAYSKRLEVMQELKDTGAWIDFTQGLDARLVDEDFLNALKRLKIKMVHFAWDRIEDEPYVFPKLQLVKEITQFDKRKIITYVLVGNKEQRILPEDMYRIMSLRKICINPYVMIYEKKELPEGNELFKLQRWVNNRFVWNACETFEDYLKYMGGIEK